MTAAAYFMLALLFSAGVDSEGSGEDHSFMCMLLPRAWTPCMWEELW